MTPAVKWPIALVAAAIGTMVVPGCAAPPSPATASSSEAREFLDRANQSLLRLGIAQSRAGWTQQTYITDDTEAIAARANQEYIDNAAKLAKDATRFDHVDASAESRRQLNLLKVSLVLATPSNAAESDELTTIAARLESTYGRGKWCPDPANPRTC